MSEHDRNGPSAGITRRILLGRMAAGASLLAIGGAAGLSPSTARAGTPGSNPGKYKLDLGGYSGPELTSDPITLRFMRQDFTPATNAALEKVYAAFNEAYPNIKIEEEKVPYGDLQKKAQVYVASGAAPDIMMGRNDFAPAYGGGQFTVPLQKYLTPEFVADLFEPLRESATVGGDLVCFPWENMPVFMLFNRDIFTKAGVEAPPEVTDVTQGWTWEQFHDALARITEKLRAEGDQVTWGLESSGYGNGGPGSNYTQLESLWVRSMGDPKADKSSSAYKTFAGVSEDGFTASGYLDTPEAAAGMKNYQALFADGLTPKGSVPDQFFGGRAATELGNMRDAHYLDVDLKDKVPFQWGASPVPRGTTSFTCSIADSPFVFAGSPHVPEAVALLAFLCNDTNRAAYHAAWGSMPSRTSLIAQDARYTTQQPYELALNVAKTSFPPPRTVGWFDYFNAVNPAVADIALGADPQERLTTVAQQIDGLLAKYK